MHRQNTRGLGVTGNQRKKWERKRALQHQDIHCQGFHMDLRDSITFSEVQSFSPVTLPSPAHVYSSLQPLISLNLLFPVCSRKVFLPCPFAAGENTDSNTQSLSCEESRLGRGAKPPLVCSHLSQDQQVLQRETEDFTCLLPDKSSLVRAPDIDIELRLQLANTIKHEGRSLLGRERKGQRQAAEMLLLQRSGDNRSGFQGLISEENKSPVTAHNQQEDYIRDAAFTPATGKRCPGGRGMKDHLPVLHRFRDVTNTRSAGLCRLPQSLG